VIENIVVVVGLLVGRLAMVGISSRVKMGAMLLQVHYQGKGP
jgi:hypothetical protein